jgi:hypothetical protein
MIATTLLELLAVRGRSVEAARATRALGLGEAGLADAPVWLEEDAIGRMLAAARIEAPVARSIGHRLVQPDGLGLLLYGLGLATPEKAYRRIQALLPRERRDASWTIDSIGDGRAVLVYHALCERPNGEVAAEALCAMRAGMLEAIPGLYGLLPARVSHASCRATGAERCRYEVVWRRERRVGLVAGLAAGLGVGLALAIGLGAASTGSGPGAIGLVLGSLGLGALGAAIGRCVDLSRQLEAVAGARRGQLALLDQADDLLASKIDAIARADAKLDSEVPVRRGRAPREEGNEGSGSTSESRYTLLDSALEIFSAAGSLECWLAELQAPPDGMPGEPRALVRQIREWSAQIAREVAPADGAGRPMDLGALVARAVASARPSVAPGAQIEIDCEPDLPRVDCDPVLMEQVVVQLVRNAVEASAGLMEAPRIGIGLRRAPGGVELAVEDRGPGLDSSEIDEVFDPFFAEPPLGAQSGFGLPVCLRIVERHGGEMRIETGDRPGTRVSVLLPESARGPSRPD